MKNNFSSIEELMNYCWCFNCNKQCVIKWDVVHEYDDSIYIEDKLEGNRLIIEAYSASSQLYYKLIIDIQKNSFTYEAPSGQEWFSIYFNASCSCGETSYSSQDIALEKGIIISPIMLERICHVITDKKKRFTITRYYFLNKLSLMANGKRININPEIEFDFLNKEETLTKIENILLFS